MKRLFLTVAVSMCEAFFFMLLLSVFGIFIGGIIALLYTAGLYISIPIIIIFIISTIYFFIMNVRKKTDE